MNLFDDGARFRCIAMDPPWPELGGGGRSAEEHYPTVPVREMPAVIRSEPTWRPDANGCHVWMWTMGRYLVSGEVAWICQQIGVRPVKTFPWIKTNEFVDERDIVALTDAELRMSLGQYGRSTHEILVLGVIGALEQLPTGRGEPDSIIAPVPVDERGRRIHSRKPPEAYAKMERISPGPRLEMFARIERPGWDRCGNEAPPQQGASA